MTKETKILLIKIIGVLVGGVMKEICNLLVQYVQNEKLESK